MIDTEDIKIIIARNISELRKTHKMTQLELAEKLNYSDKAVSKWERGESLPDISILKEIAALFGVTVDWLMAAEHTDNKVLPAHRTNRNRVLITGISVLLVWLIATLCFTSLDFFSHKLYGHWLSFVYAIPASDIVWLVFNSIWFDRKRNFLIVSMLMWSSLLSAFLTALLFDKNIWLIFLLGIPSQAIIMMWSGIKIKKVKNNK